MDQLSQHMETFVKSFLISISTFFLIENRLDDRGDTSKRSAENFLESQQQIKNRRLGKDDKLAKEAKLPFTVRVR